MDRSPRHRFPAARQRHRFLELLAGVVAATVIAATPADAQVRTIRDDFAGDTLSPSNWFACQRDENEFSIVTVPEGFRAARMRVNPRYDIGLYAGLLLGRRECRTEPGGGYVRDNYDERAEIWESDAATLTFGTEAWYRFAMYVDPDIPDTDVNRLVIGQWKQSSGHSPVVAQRFKGRRFTITIEQDFEGPLAYRGIDECRILIGHDAAYPATTSAAVDWPRETWMTAPGSDGGMLTAAAAHSRTDSLRNELARSKPCARDVQVTALGLLPNPFGAWVTMLYRIKLGLDGTGIVEVWANGRPIAVAAGRIGFRDGAAMRQYFKFGPYRNHVTYSSHAMLAKFARGATRADVEGP